jgi:hypothetical protein
MAKALSRTSAIFMGRLRCVLKRDGDPGVHRYHAIPMLRLRAQHTMSPAILQVLFARV